MRRLVRRGWGLTGFILTNAYNSGFGASGGGVWCSSTNVHLTNCVIVGNIWPFGNGGGASGGTLYNCVLSNNAALFGGGVAGCTLVNCVLTGNGTLGNGEGGAADGSTLSYCTLSGNQGNYCGGASGSTLYNCTLTGNSGAQGGGALECTLYNCTLIGNSSPGDVGGGANSSTLYNCTLTGNTAAAGGGASSSTLYNCALTGNSASGPYFFYGTAAGGGAYYSKLYNCTVVDNVSSGDGGGAVLSTLANCILAYNAAWTDDNYTADSTLDYCCTEPLPTNGISNISVPPLFVDYASGNLRLQSNSPCINAGNNAYVTTTADLDGNPRIVGGTVDMGAYEHQGDGSVISYAWLQQYGLPTDGSADFIDSAGNGMNHWQDWVCGLSPTNPLAVLRMLPPSFTRTNATVTWQSVAGVNYFLERGANLAVPFTLLATNILGQAGTTSYADTNATGSGPFFYRVGVTAP